jgi:hypothetical protein
VAYPDATRVNSLLSEICIERGWCLPPGAVAEVRRAVSTGIESVIDGIIRTELEIDPVMCDRETRRWLAGKVDDWLFDPVGRGASSELPL